MPEIQNLKINNFEESSIDIDTLTYKDKALRKGITKCFFKNEDNMKELIELEL